MSSLPPPPKMSGLTTPSSSSGATSFNRFHTPTSSTSRHQTPPPPQTSFSSNSNSKSKSKSSSSSDFLSTSYENFAPRSAEQRSRLARIASLTAGPYHSSPPDGEETKDETPFPLSTAMCPPKPPSLDPLQILHGKSTATPSDHPTAILATTLHQTHRTTASLATLLRSTASLRLALRASLNIADDLTRRHADLLRHSGELSAAAERLQHEEAVLTRRAEEIGRPLKHYDDVDGIGALVGLTWSEGGRVARKGAGRVDVDEEEDFVAVLVGVDEAMEFFGEGVEGEGRRRLPRGGEYDAAASGGAEYFRRACALQDAALELLRVAVADRISVISTQIQDALNLPKVPLKADKLEASLVYTRFHGISKRSNKLITVARRRLDALGDGSVAAVGYEDLLALCRNTYCGAREVLLTSTVRNHMDILKERHGLVGMTRLASVFLIRLCTVETALYLDFFGDPDKRRHPRKALKGSVQTNEEGKGEEGEEAEEEGNQEAAATQQQQHSNNNNNNNNNSKKLPAAATLASQILSEDSTFRDAEFQSMLGGLCSSLHRTIRRGLVSILDLDVLCQVVSVLREERAVANKSPTTMAAARAVSGVIQDAQERLIFCANTALHKEVVRFKPTPADLNYPGKLLGEKPKAAIVIEDDKTDSKEASTEEHKEESKDPSATSDPNDAVAAQLRVYESWFPPMRSVLRILSKIFRVVEPRVFEDIALQSVQSCTKSLKEGSVYILRASGQIHADLFLVKHLLILREQLSPFDIQLRSVERQLDFSEAGKAVSRFLANRNRRLFSMSTENALITLLREGVSVQESSVDSKRDLEDCLRSACNDFIEHTSSSLLGPIAIFVDQCKNAVGSGSGSTDVLIKAPFMNAVLVKGVFSRALENLDGALENVSKQMHLYLENTATQSILMKPVVRKMTRSLEEARRFVGEVPDGANNWEEGAKEEVLKISEEFETKVKLATSKHGTR